MNKFVSIIMSVYNSSNYIDKAISSILNQTYNNFEFIIIDDKSTDDSLLKIKKWKDKRIVIIENENNIGLTASLNIGIKKSKGEYILRMDSDDFSLKNRISIQVNFMENNKSIDIAGSYFKYFGDISWYYYFKTIKCPIDPHEISAKLLFGTPFLHSSIIIRKSVIPDNINFYNEKYKIAQDYELFTRLNFKCKLQGIPKVLVKYRISDNQSLNNFKLIRQHNCKLIQSNYLKELFERDLTMHESNVHTIIYKNYNISNPEFKEILNWLKFILLESKYNNKFNYSIVKNECAIIFSNILIKNKLIYNRFRFLFFESDFGSFYNFSIFYSLYLIVKLYFPFNKFDK
jgi:glycosyltransferase involved in cell wall biosynthesis